MTDYGHELVFGSFITPAAGNPEHVVALAQLSEQADPGLVPVIDRLEQEYVVIHEVVQDVDRALVNLVRQPGDFTELQEAVDVLTDTLGSHLAYEEQQITEPLARHSFFPGQI